MNKTMQEAFAAFKAARRESADAQAARNDAEQRADEARERDRAAKTKLDNARAALHRALEEASSPGVAE